MSNTLEDEKRKNSFLKNGFIYDEQFDSFVREGYGSFLTNVTGSDKKKVEASIKVKPFYTYYLERGYELVVGPAAPDDCGVLHDNTLAIYVANYPDMIRKYQPWKEKATKRETVLTTADIDSIIVKVGELAKSYSTVMSHCLMGFNFGDILESEARKTLDYEKKLLDNYNDMDLYTIIRELKSYYGLKTGINERKYINQTISRLSDNLYDKIARRDCSINAKVDDLAKTAIRLVDDHKIVALHTGIGYNFGDQMDNVIDGMSTLIGSINLECSVEEANGVISQISKHYTDRNGGMPEGAQFIINSLKEEIKEKTFKEYFGDNGKAPKTNR